MFIQEIFTDKLSINQQILVSNTVGKLVMQVVEGITNIQVERDKSNLPARYGSRTTNTNTNRKFLLERDLGLVCLESVNNDQCSSRVRVREQLFAKLSNNCKFVREVRERFANIVL